MAATGLTRRGSFHLLRSVNVNRRNSCPDLRVSRIQIHPQISSRNLNLMVMNPRAPKIRHLNASHPLLIELEENVKKVQDLEYKVLVLEKQLQFRELMKKQQTSTEKVDSPIAVKHKTVITKEEELAFRKRLEEAKRKAELLSLKRNEEEEKIMRSYQQNKLMLTINQMTKISEEDYSSVKLLDKPAEVDGKAVLFSDIEALVDLVHQIPDQSL